MPKPPTKRQLEQEALGILRRIGKRRHFGHVFATIRERAVSDVRGSCDLVWRDLEELLALDLERES